MPTNLPVMMRDHDSLSTVAQTGNVSVEAPGPRADLLDPMAQDFVRGRLRAKLLRFHSDTSIAARAVIGKTSGAAILARTL